MNAFDFVATARVSDWMTVAAVALIGVMWWRVLTQLFDGSRGR